MEDFRQSLMLTTDYDSLWHVLEPGLGKSWGVDNVCLFAEVLDQTIPQVLKSTGQTYEKLPPAHCRDMVLQSPLLAYLRSNPQATLIHWTDYAGSKEEHVAHSHFQTFITSFGWQYFICMTIWQTDNILASVLLARTEEQGDFSLQERQQLQSIYPFIEAAILRAHRQYNKEQEYKALLNWGTATATPSLLLKWDLSPLLITSSALPLLFRWSQLPYDRRRTHPPELPEDMLKICRRLKQEAFLLIEGYNPPGISDSTVITCPHEPGLEAHLSILPPPEAGPALPFLQIRLVDEHSPAPSSGDEIRPLLSHNELELFDAVCEGLSNQQIADKTGKTLGTIKTQLSNLYTRLRVRSRAELISRWK